MVSYLNNFIQYILKINKIISNKKPVNYLDNYAILIINIGF